MMKDVDPAVDFPIDGDTWQRFLASSYLSQRPEDQVALTRAVQAQRSQLSAGAGDSSAAARLLRDLQGLTVDQLQALALCSMPWGSGVDAAFAQIEQWLSVDGAREVIFLENSVGGLVSALQTPHLVELLATSTQVSLHFCQGPHKDAALELLANELADAPFNVHFFAQGATWGPFRDELIERAAQIRGICDELLRAPNTALYALQNAPNQARDGDLATLCQAFRGLPAVLCGAGATLEGALPHLTKIAQSGLLIGCGSAALTLQRHGIAHHAVASICPLRTSFDRWQPLDDFTAPAWTCLRAYPSVVEMMFGPRLHLTGLSRSPSVQFVEGALGYTDLELDFGGSVLTAALRTCVYLGCTPILLIGVDLCYTAQGEKYATGISPEQAPTGGFGVSALAREVRICDGKEDELLTNQPWLSERAWIERLLAAFPETRVLNASPRGLAIKGANTCSYDEWCTHFAPQQRDFGNLLYRQIAASSSRETQTVDTFELLRQSLLRCIERASQEICALPLKKLREGSADAREIWAHIERLESAFAGELAFDVLFKPMQDALESVHQKQIRQMKSGSATHFSEVSRARHLLKLVAQRLAIFNSRGKRLLDAIERSCTAFRNASTR